MDIECFEVRKIPFQKECDRDSDFKQQAKLRDLRVSIDEG